MSAAVGWLRHGLRDMQLVRSVAIRVLTPRQPPGGAPGGVLFLFYHDMRARERRAFVRQLQYFRALGPIVGLSDALRRLADGRADERCVCLTFDDGYQGAFDHAFPILAEQGLPAAFFVVPGWMDAARPGVFGWDACRHLAAGGMEVGSHSLGHRRFAELSRSEAETELARSRARIEAELDRPCVHFACPWGQPGADYRPERDPGLARAAGYQSFLTTIPRRATAASDPWSLPRVRMEPGWGEAELHYAFARHADREGC